MSGREPTGDEDEVAAVVVDAAIDVHRHLGPAFAESVYENAPSRELMMRGVVVELKATGPRLALVLNFGIPRTQSGIRRVVRTR